MLLNTTSVIERNLSRALPSIAEIIARKSMSTISRLIGLGDENALGSVRDVKFVVRYLPEPTKTTTMQSLKQSVGIESTGCAKSVAGVFCAAIAIWD